MDSDIILNNIIREELQYFYRYIRIYDKSRDIDIIFTDNVYAKVLEYDICDVQKNEVMKEENDLNKLNGTVFFASSKDKPTLVVLSKKVLPNRVEAEVRQTLIHEMTHAHDFYDYAEFLNINDYNALFDSKYYREFFFWTEFHARRTGYKRFIEYMFRKSWKKLKKQKKEYLGGIKANFLIHSSKGRLYDLMQAIGRYSTFIELCPSHIENFEEEILYGAVEINLITIFNDIYNFLVTNNEFETFTNNIAIFNDLLKKVDSIVSQ